MESQRKSGKGSNLTDHDESFVKLGTPLPPLTSTKPDRNEFVPIWKQEVTDEQGRRRLHGAFTGGFSAGYFNTVGSKEGWNPATFKSSRNDKKKSESGFKSQRPEDFMDEEDLAELNQSKELETNSAFGSSSIKSSYLTNQSYDPLTGKVENFSSSSGPLQQPSRSSAVDLAFSDFVEPSDIRAGYKIMKKMGWRDGQGIGPRVTHERKILLASKLGLNLNSEIDLDEDPERKKHMFAPIDRPLKAVQPWPGLSGLGYSNSTFQPTEEPQAGPFSLPTTLETTDQALRIPQGSSFGLGALNDTEDDDQDVYESVSDQVTSDPRARRLLNLSELGANGKSSSALPAAKVPDKRVDQKSKVFQDNTNLPKRFCLSVEVKENAVPTSYAPPKVPEAWKPCPKKIWDAAVRPTQPSTVQTNPRHHNRPNNADDRARLIGEKTPSRSIFDFISAKDKARLEDAQQLALASSNKKNSDQEAGHHDIPPTEALIVIPKLDPVIAKSALSGFVPFAHDPAKQERYKLYLQSQAGLLPAGTRFAPKTSKEITVEGVNKELDGFAKSAMMFKPMSAMMASRFTTAGSSTTGGELAAPEPGLRQPVFLDEPSETGAPLEETQEETNQPISQADQAVQIDMFGKLTRSIKEFYPQKLLCKRFNVPNPFPDGPPTVDAASKPSSNLTEFLASRGFEPARSTATHTSKEGSEQENAWLRKGDNEDMVTTTPVNQVGLGGDETQGREILTSKRPPLDLFKAIFSNDAGDDDDDADENIFNDLKNDPDEFLIPDNPPFTLAVDKRISHETTKPDETELTQQVISITPVVVDPNAIEKLGNFRPTFNKKKQLKEDDDANDKVGKKKNKRRVLISFDDDQVDADADSKIKKKKRKEKNKKVQPSHQLCNAQDGLSEKILEETNHDDEAEDEWVETLVNLPQTCQQNNSSNKNQPKPSARIHPKLQRMKASDLMD